ncbi:ATPase, partial [Vibrio coralliirubri]
PEPEPEPEPVRAANMPEIIPNEFGVPEDDDWLIEDEASEPEELAETDVTPEPVTPVAEPQLDTEPQVEATPQAEVAEQAEVLGQEGDEEFSFDDFELPEFGEEDALAEADAESTTESVLPAVEPQAEAKEQDDEEFSFNDFELPEFSEEDALAEADAESTPESVTPAIDAQPSVEPQAEAQVKAQGQDDEEFSFDDFELPEFGEEDALAEADAELTPEPVTPAIDAQPSAESQPTAEPQLDAAPQAETAKPESEEEFSFDDFELPEFGEEDALAEVVSEPDEAQLEQDLAPDTEKFEFDDLDLPEYDEESAKADSVLDDIEQSNAEPVAEDQGVEFDELDLPEYGEDEAISDAFAEKPTPLTSFSPQGEEQDALHDLFSNPQSYSQADDFSNAEGSEPAGFAQPEQSLSAASEPNSTPTALQDEPLEGFDDFDETALAELLSEDVQDSVDNMFDKPLDATSIDSAGLDIDAMLEVGGEDWKGFNLAPEQQSSMHN